MRVSLITITYNNAAGLERTLASVHAQSYRGELEHIIVDGESTDDTAEVLRRYNGKCTVVRRPARGVYDAINGGLEACTGDVVGLLHSGDVFCADNVLDLVANYMERHTETHFVYGNILRANGRRYSGARASRRSLLCGFAPPHPSLYIRRAAQMSVGLYRDDYITAADYEMMIRLFFNEGLRGQYLPVDFVTMSAGGLSTRFINRLWVNNRERLRALRQNSLPASPLALIRHYFY